ncbi:hypothetical protein F4604DRAFT_1683342 [Suillus subluteus]|nr:hypothetical protein F4604DRAFT_1687060 [Suillus subluteus]KAG1864329.1 hypothetical protein F4604DRAFT_1683342 [Suillus subluteus]
MRNAMCVFPAVVRSGSDWGMHLDSPDGYGTERVVLGGNTLTRVLWILKRSPYPPFWEKFPKLRKRKLGTGFRQECRMVGGPDGGANHAWIMHGTGTGADSGEDSYGMVMEYKSGTVTRAEVVTGATKSYCKAYPYYSKMVRNEGWVGGRSESVPQESHLKSGRLSSGGGGRGWMDNGQMDNGQMDNGRITDG